MGRATRRRSRARVRRRNTIQAEALSSRSNPNPHLENSDTTLGFFDVGTWFCFDGVDMTGLSGIDLQMAAANNRRRVLRAGSTASTAPRSDATRSPPRRAVGAPGRRARVALTQTSGVHSLSERGSGYGISNLDWLTLDSSSAPAAGATTPFVSYEAESGSLGARRRSWPHVCADHAVFEPRARVVGARYVRLKRDQSVRGVDEQYGKEHLVHRCSGVDPGQYRWQREHRHPGFVRQWGVPSSAHPQLEADLGIRGNDHYNNETQTPSDGSPRTFFDDAHTFISGAAVAPGSTIRLQKSAANTAAFYNIDVVDLEAPPPPIGQPGNSLSITADCGAVANDSSVDNANSIQNCINNAKSQGKTLWIPSAPST